MCLSDSTVSAKRKAETPALVEETEEDLSGTQFVCETVIRSLTLDAAPDHNPPCRQRSPQSECPYISLLRGREVDLGWLLTMLAFLLEH